VLFSTGILFLPLAASQDVIYRRSFSVSKVSRMGGSIRMEQGDNRREGMERQEKKDMFIQKEPDVGSELTQKSPLKNEVNMTAVDAEVKVKMMSEGSKEAAAEADYEDTITDKDNKEINFMSENNDGDRKQAHLGNQLKQANKDGKEKYADTEDKIKPANEDRKEVGHESDVKIANGKVDTMVSKSKFADGVQKEIPIETGAKMANTFGVEAELHVNMAESKSKIEGEEAIKKNTSSTRNNGTIISQMFPSSNILEKEGRQAANEEWNLVTKGKRLFKYNFRQSCYFSYQFQNAWANKKINYSLVK
jgi:hypothetical protein